MSKDSTSYLSVDKSLSILFESIPLSHKKENVHTFQAMGRVLSNDIVSRTNIPKFHTSHMDGYAVRSKDVLTASAANPIRLKISKHESVLGVIPRYRIKKGEAFRIHTGGNLPLGSDAVFPVENTQTVNEQTIQICEALKSGSFINIAGSDIKKGDKVMHKQQIILAQHLGLLAALQLSEVAVYSKPVVSIIPTGNELTDKIEQNKNNKKSLNTKIINTNGHIIACLVRELGGQSLDMGITPDDPIVLKEKIKTALGTSDLLLTIGGTSAGKFDVVKSTIAQMGSPGLIASRVKLDRGRVAGLAILNRKPIVVLPGPVQGALNAFFIFARPIISLLSGRKMEDQFHLVSILTDKWTARKKFHDFKKVLYVKLNYSKSKQTLFAKPVTGDTQSISTVSQANAYVVIPEDVKELLPGDKIQAILLPGFSYFHDLRF